MLHYDLDASQLTAVANELGATGKQVKYSLTRAMHRTESTLRKMSSKGLQKVLQLRALTALRKRLKGLKLRRGKDGESFGLWYGLNPLPISSFKGRPAQGATGATFRGQEYAHGFVAPSKVKGKRTIFKRAGHGRLPIVEQLLPIEDAAMVFIEDEVFDKVLDIFWQHFERDLRARVKYLVGRQT